MNFPTNYTIIAASSLNADLSPWQTVVAVRNANGQTRSASTFFDPMGLNPVVVMQRIADAANWYGIELGHAF